MASKKYFLRTKAWLLTIIISSLVATSYLLVTSTLDIKAANARKSSNNVFEGSLKTFQNKAPLPTVHLDIKAINYATESSTKVVEGSSKAFQNVAQHWRANLDLKAMNSKTKSVMKVVEGSSKTFQNEIPLPKGNLGDAKATNATESTMEVVKLHDDLHWSIKETLNPAANEYLAPTHIFKDFGNTPGWKDRNKTYADFFRTGYGLTPFTTEDNEKAWMENGVVYRPIREKLRLMSSHPSIPMRHPSDFEHYVPFDEKRFYSGGKAPPGEEAKPKIILWYQRIAYVSPMPDLQPLRICPDFPCRITTNKTYANESSAMLFEATQLSDLPRRRPEQVFVFHFTETLPKPGESRFTKLKSPPWKDAFNWTMSFRMNADIQSYYGIIRKRPQPLEKNYTAIVARKSKMAATLIGHCQTEGLREVYIKTLRKYMDVDIYGDCGKFRCPRDDDVRCGEIIDSKYKFYLAFENAVCDEYITEKFFRYMTLDTVVVARGGADYLKHAPPGTFINAADFSSSKDLADYLNHLDKHPAEYEAILREKAKYMSMFEAWYHAHGNRVSFTHYHYEAVPTCRICHRLWNLKSYHKTIPDIHAWLYKFTCRNAKSFL